MCYLIVVVCETPPPLLPLSAAPSQPAAPQSSVHSGRVEELRGVPRGSGTRPDSKLTRNGYSRHIFTSP